MARRNRQLATRLALAGAAVALPLAMAGPASAAVTTNVTGGELTVSSDSGDGIQITSEGGNVKVNGFNPGGGAVASSAITSIEVNGGPGANLIDLNGVTTAAFTALGDVDVDAGAGNDEVRGSQRPDDIQGGEGNDRLVAFTNPAGTRDLMQGGEGDDTLVWNPGDGSDTADGQAGSDTIEVNGGAAAEEFTVAASATPGRISFDRVTPGPFNVDIGTAERLDLNANGGDDTLNKAGGATGLTALAIDADGGDGNDTLNGGDAADTLTGGAGNDRLAAFRNPAGSRDVMTGGDGDDTLVWNPGDGDDTMDGQAGTDRTEVNGGGGGEQFRIKPSAIPGRVQFDRTGPTPPGPFNLDIGTTEVLDLNANGGNDDIDAAERRGLGALMFLRLNGGDGDDAIRGGDGGDAISGGAGRDTLDSRDGGADAVTCGTESDSLIADPQDAVDADCELVDRGVNADTIAPRVNVSRKAVKVNRSRLAGVRVSCPGGETSCVVKVELRRNGRSLGARRITIAGGQSRVVNVRLSRRTAAAVRRNGRLGVKAVVTARDVAGNSRRSTLRLTLKSNSR